MSLLSSRRRPYPFHARLGSILSSPSDRIGLMLVAKESGLLVGRKQQMLDGVVPSEQEYGSAPVYRERTWTGKPTGGYGERVQSGYGDRRYYWGMDVQVSGGLFGKGPLLHPISPSTAAGGGVAKFIDGFNTASNTPTQFVLAGTKAYRRQDDTNAGQALDRDFGAGVFPQDGVVFQGGFAGAAKSLYVTTNTGQLWERTPGGTWTQAAAISGFNFMRLEVVGTELWAADCINCVVRKVSADPKVAANWSGPIFIGDPSVPISAIRQTGNVLVIFKQDGSLFTLNSDGTTNDLFPGLTTSLNSDNGYRAAAWMNALWFRVGPSFYRLEVPGMSLTPVGPGRLLDNASPVRGEPRAFCGWGGYAAYLVIWSPLDNVSYLLSYGSWEMRQSEDGSSQAVFDDQWDGALAHWTGKQATALAVSGASGVDRLYIGFADGTWSWIKLVQNPLATGSGAEFNLGPAEIVFPLHHAMFQADLKHWLGFSLFGPVLRVGDEATLSYRIMASAGGPPTDPTGNWLLLGEFTANGQRIPAPPNMAGNALQLKIGLSNSDSTTTPVVETVAIHERVVPAFKRDLSFTVDGRAVISRLDGAAYRPNPDRVHQAMMDAAAFPGSQAIELPDETVNEIAVFDYREALLPMAAGGGHAWQIDVQATQFRILTIYGIIGRLRGTRIGDLRGYTIGSLHYL
jgi:hypothetical protein